ncbi:hypothetical protein AB0H71_10180 [Nocardia sp. NPDC050697]|uniref:hypothetical protein n=1 Tax=Nocardia sp. NPDC050697 TaxID=3155158 RepID=UPI0033C99030
MTTSRRRVVFDTEVNPDWVPILSAAPMELILTEPLPELCSEHGLPAVERRAFHVDSSGPLSELPTVRRMLQTMVDASPFGRRPAGTPTEARVRFECPACAFCLAEIRKFRWGALLALVLVPLTVAAIVVAVHFELDQFFVPLGFAVIPGCMPLALMAAVLWWGRSGYFADVWMNEKADQLIVSAHPDFADAVERARRR